MIMCALALVCSRTGVRAHCESRVCASYTLPYILRYGHVFLANFAKLPKKTLRSRNAVNYRTFGLWECAKTQGGRSAAYLVLQRKHCHVKSALCHGPTCASGALADVSGAACWSALRLRPTGRFTEWNRAEALCSTPAHTRNAHTEHA